MHSFSRFLRESGTHKPDTLLRLPLDVTGAEGAGYVSVQTIWTVEATPDEQKVAQAYVNDRRWVSCPVAELDPSSLIPTQYTLLQDDIDKFRDFVSGGPINVLCMDGLYFLVDGHHRAAAAVLDGDATIAARVMVPGN
jgi:hypothetical protein